MREHICEKKTTHKKQKNIIDTKRGERERGSERGGATTESKRKKRW